MPKPPTLGIKQAFAKLITHDIPSIILCLALFFGGIWLLSLRIPGWSLFFGLIIIPIGAAFTIFTLDDVARNIIIPSGFKPVRCNICGKTTYAKEDVEDVICAGCREDISEEVLRERGELK